MSTSGTVTHAVDGKTDIMYAPSTEAVLFVTVPELKFAHLLTQLDIALVTSEETAEFTVTELKLVRTAGDKDGKLNNVCEVNLNEENLADAVNFSSDGSTTKLACYQPGGDSEFESVVINKTSSNDVVAYILAPSLKAEEVYPGEIDYTLEVTYSIDGKASDTKTAKINLEKNDPPGGAYEDDTSGKRFIVTLTFAAGGIAATATITSWGTPVERDKNETLENCDPTKATLTEASDAEDGLTNCYMVVPGKQLVFPVKRAYNLNQKTLRTTGKAYTGKLKATVLWETKDVIKGDPQVNGEGNTAMVWLKTNKNKGNAVIALRKADTETDTTIVWSYHIWVTDYVPTKSNLFSVANNTCTYNIFDVDLGDESNTALTDGGAGLVYQWGRKDPFNVNAITKASPSLPWVKKGSNETVGGISVQSNQYVHENPTTFITFTAERSYIYSGSSVGWASAKKSVTDPCPGASRVIYYYGNIGGSNSLKNESATWAATDYYRTLNQTSLQYLRKYFVKYDGTSLWYMNLFWGRWSADRYSCATASGDPAWPENMAVGVEDDDSKVYYHRSVEKCLQSTPSSTITYIVGLPVRCAYHTK
jgi:hypothetical protein